MEKKDPTVFVDSYGKIHTERKILSEEEWKKTTNENNSVIIGNQ